jgi:hypothetical protein
LSCDGVSYLDRLETGRQFSWLARTYQGGICFDLTGTDDELTGNEWRQTAGSPSVALRVNVSPASSGRFMKHFVGVAIVFRPLSARLPGRLVRMDDTEGQMSHDRKQITKVSRYGR